MRVPIYKGVGDNAAPPIGMVNIDDAVEEKNLAAMALVPLLRKERRRWIVVGWHLIPITDVDTRHVELL